MKKGILLIGIERQEQITKHKHTVKQDAELNASGQLINAALTLIKSKGSALPKSWTTAVVLKMKDKSEIERLTIAGALIAAEIDRLQYKKLS